MSEKMMNSWAFKFHSFFDITNFLSFPSDTWDKRFTKTEYVSKKDKLTNADILLGYFMLTWATLYLVYKKCLNSLLRRMHFPLVQRNRIVEAVWNCGFCFGSALYFKMLSNKTANFSSHGWEISQQEVAIALHKSFFFHHAGIAFLCHGSRIKGLGNLLFASFIISMHEEKWCTLGNTSLFYKAFNMMTIDVCRILLCLNQITGRIGKVFPKILFFIHCFNWVYIYVYFIPRTMLWPEKVDSTRVELAVWLWFIIECLDSAWLKLCGCAKSTYWLEICLFPPPTQEAIELANIQKRHRDSLKKSVVHAAPNNTKLWQTLLCAMIIKKKVKKMRQAKEDNVASANTSTCECLSDLSQVEEHNNETQSDVD